MKVLIIANCHAKPLSILCEALCPGSTFPWVEVNRLKEEDRPRVTALIEDADTVLYYPVADSWKNDFVRSSYIRAHARQSQSLTNVYFAGLHPDVTLIGKGGARLQSPLADYHSRIAVLCFLKGLPAEEAIRRVAAAEVATAIGYDDVWARSLAELKKRSDLADVSFYEEFHEILMTRLPLFVVNHPSTFLLFEYATKIVRHLGLRPRPMTAECFPQWMLSNAVFPVFDYVVERNALPYRVGVFKPPRKDEYYDLETFVGACYALYATYAREEMVIMDEFAKWNAAFDRHLGG